MIKRFTGLLTVALLAGGITLGSYKLFFEESAIEVPAAVITESKTIPNYVPTTYTRGSGLTDVDFTEAASKTVNAVVHVKHLTINRSPRNYMEYLRNKGGSGRKEIAGAGSGVIITEDGYIVTNNHVIEGAAELQVTLNNNKTYYCRSYWI